MVDLRPTRGREIRKVRPCVIVSPDELNAHLSTFLAAPLTTGSHNYPFRVPLRFRRKDGHIVLDQIRCIDGERLVERLGAVPEEALTSALAILREMFAE